MRKLDLHRMEKPDNAKQKEAAKNAKPKSIPEAFEYIVELAADSNLDEGFYDKAAGHIKYATRKLKLTARQAVLLSMFVDHSESGCITLSDIARYSGCRTTKILRLSNDIDVLEAKHYVIASRGRKSLSYRVPMDVLKALRNNTPYVHQPEPIPDTATFFDRFQRLMNEKRDGEHTYCSLLTETMDMLEEIKDTVFARNLCSSYLCSEDKLLFILMAHLYVENNDDRIGFGDLENLFPESNIPHRIQVSNSWIVFHHSPINRK